MGPLVPNKIVGRNAITLGFVLTIIGLVVLRWFTKFFYKHVLLMGDDNEVEDAEETTEKKNVGKANSGSRREKLDWW